LEWSTPSDLVSQVQATFPQVTAKQIHFAWRKMSQIVWKRQDDPMKSVYQLLEEFQESGTEVNVLHPEGVPEGAEILAFCFPRIIERLQANDQKIEEIGLDATCELILYLNPF
jgi:hypothetical protein